MKNSFVGNQNVGERTSFKV